MKISTWWNNDKAYTICQETAERGAFILVLGGRKYWAQKVNISIHFKEWLGVSFIKWTLSAYLVVKFYDTLAFWLKTTSFRAIDLVSKQSKEKQTAKLILDFL